MQPVCSLVVVDMCTHSSVTRRPSAAPRLLPVLLLLLLFRLLLLPAAAAQMTSFTRYILSEALVCSWQVLLGSVHTIAPLQQVAAFAARLMCCAS